MGQTSRKPIFRATLSPCEPSGIAQPIATSSILSGATPARATASRTTKAPQVFGARLSGETPLVRSPKGRPNTFYNRYITHGLVPEWLIVHEHILNTLHGFWFTAEEEELFLLQLQEFGFDDFCHSNITPAQDFGQGTAHATVMGTDLPCILHAPESGKKRVAYPSRPATLRRRGLMGR